jgi:hypothetical protein
MDIRVLHQLYERTSNTAQAIGKLAEAGDAEACALFESHVHTCRLLQRELWAKIRAFRRSARAAGSCRPRTLARNPRADVRYVESWQAPQNPQPGIPTFEPEC